MNAFIVRQGIIRVKNWLEEQWEKTISGEGWQQKSQISNVSNINCIEHWGVSYNSDDIEWLNGSHILVLWC